jgi:pyridoxal phosphate enzyme (YggS family)
MDRSPVMANLARINSVIAAAADRSGRDPAAVTLVAVTKGMPAERVREGMAAGLKVFGENRIQEALPKIDEVGSVEVSWHLIGHLQRNKVKFVEGHFDMLQSVDSLELVESLDGRISGTLDTLIEVNVAAEPQKTGALSPAVLEIARAILESSRLRLRGLMTIAPQSPDPELARPVFRRLASLRRDLAERLEVDLPVLSMGMTDDYAVAVEEGSTMLRLGRALFGSR